MFQVIFVIINSNFYDAHTIQFDNWSVSFSLHRVTLKKIIFKHVLSFLGTFNPHTQTIYEDIIIELMVYNYPSA